MRLKDKTVICICGMGGSGKDTVIEYIFDEIKGSIVNGRLIVEDDLKKRGMEVNNTTLREHATFMRQSQGMDIIARKSIEWIKKEMKSVDLVVYNLKAMEELDTLRKELPYRTLILGVHANPRTRFERLKKRGLAYDMKDYESLVWRDRVELKWGVGEAFALADYMIVNEGTLRELRESTKRFVKFLAD